MLRTYCRALSIGLFALLTAPHLLYAGQTVAVEAGQLSYTEDGKVLKAKDDVRIKWGESVLSADAVTVEQGISRIVSEGRLELETPEIMLRAERCEIFYEDETGTLDDVSVTFKDRSGGFGGEVIEKRTGRRYSLKDGYYTTCETIEGKSPEWELAGEEVEIEVDGYGTIRGGTFRVKGVPILYVPYAVFPTSDRRQTGLLLPEFGLSDDRGFLYSQPFFWNISKHRDLTVSSELETSARVGLDAEYRYKPSLNIEGELDVQYYNEHIRGNQRTEVEVQPPKQAALDAYNIPTNRGSAELRHRQRLGDQARIYADALVVSDDLYLREIDASERHFSDSSVRRTLRYTRSRFGAMLDHGFANVGVRSTTYQDIDITNVDVPKLTRSDSLTLQRPVELWGVVDGERSGFTYGLDGSLSSFMRGEGDDGERFDTTVSLGRHLTGNLPIRADAWARGRLTAYHMEETSVLDDQGQFVRELDDLSARGVVEAGIDARTTLARAFSFGGDDSTGGTADSRGTGATILDHVLEPFASFRYTSESSDDDLPLYDGVDRIDGRTTMTYGLLSRFHLRDQSTAGQSEAARFSISQSYNFDDDVLEDHFSDVDFLVAFRPIRGFSATGLASYNVGASELSGATSAISARGFKLPYEAASESRIEAVYRFVGAEAVGGTPSADIDDLESIEGRIILGLTDRVSVGFNSRYDVATNSAVEQGGGIRLESACDCWAIELGVTSRVNPDENQVRLRIELAGLGNAGASPLEFRSPGLAGLEKGETGYWRSGW
jgi:LPS-assembly protein